jgi:mannose-6-phosphate isomerase-like protein (cupin superfamily)
VWLSTPFAEVHRLTILPNVQCSMHMHQHKWNSFHVISGRLIIEVEKSDYPLTDKTELGPGESTTVKPGEYHRFRTGDEPCEAIECYYPAALSEDIKRRDCGGEVGESPDRQSLAIDAYLWALPD